MHGKNSKFQKLFNESKEKPSSYDVIFASSYELHIMKIRLCIYWYFDALEEQKLPYDIFIYREKNSRIPFIGPKSVERAMCIVKLSLKNHVLQITRHFSLFFCKVMNPICTN